MRRLLVITAAGLLAGCQDGAPSDGLAEPTFVGSASCAACHETEYTAWRESHHALAMQPVSVETVLGDFDDAAFEYFGDTATFRSRDGRFFVETGDEHGERREYQVSEVFGVYPLQQYLVDFPGGRKQALPFAWDSRDEADGGQRWFHLYPDEYIGPGDELHWTGHYQNWNTMCAECHSTNLEMNFDLDTNSFDTSWSEISVGCEACHGPGSRHATQADAGAFDANLGLVVDLDDARGATWVPNAATGIATRNPAPDGALRQPEACGRCHARRAVAGTQYEYGKPLADTHAIALLDDPLYHADGQILDEVYVYGSFVQSRMYAAGVTCSDCHEPHSTALRTGPEPSAVCATCHAAAKFATTDHSGHQPGDAACVDCHMATQTYMGVDERRDHSFRVPRPDLAAAIGTPVACDNCHDDDRALAAAGETRSRPHFGEIIAAGRAHADNALLLSGAADPDYPGIARATILALLRPPFSATETDALRTALTDSDPLVRVGALRAVSLATHETQLAVGATTLADPVRSVRFEAVTAFAGIRDLLPLADARAFGAAAADYAATQRALGASPGVLANLANFTESMGDTAQANAYFRMAVDASPGSAVLRHALGLSEYRAGRPDEALEQLGLAHELAPAEPRFVYVYGVALNSLGTPDDAIAVLSRAHDEHPDDFDIGWALATVLRDAGDRDAARSVADELAAGFPGDADVAALLRELERDASH